MLTYILILELSAVSGAGGFNLTDCEKYTGQSRYKLRKMFKELIKLNMLVRKGNKFQTTVKGELVYNACLGGQKPIFTKEQFNVSSNEPF